MVAHIISHDSETDFQCRLRVASCAWRSKEKGVKRNQQPATHIDFHDFLLQTERKAQPATDIDFPCACERVCMYIVCKYIF